MKKRQRPYITTSTIKRPIRLKRSPLLLLENATDFQKAVYTAALKIPKGQTRSYKWVAEKTGRPRAYRAVGGALNKNPYPGIIPCHRVVKSDGTIGGFSKGVSVKKRLLSNEGIMI